MNIEVRDISFAYNSKPVFDHFSLDLNLHWNGRPLVILGSSGCGKTTLLKLLGGLLKPFNGSIVKSCEDEPKIESEGGRRETIKEEEGTGLSRVSIIFQETRLLPWLTVLENVRLPLEKDFGREEADERARYFLSLFSLAGKECARPGELSGGEAQRVSMARAFAWPSELLLMDEPFQSMDIPLRINLMAFSLSLLEKEKRHLIAVTHDPREAVFLGGRIIILGKPGQGIVFDKNVELSQEERAWGSSAARGLEREMIGALGNTK